MYSTHLQTNIMYTFIPLAHLSPTPLLIPSNHLQPPKQSILGLLIYF